MLLVSPERLFMSWHTPKRKETHLKGKNYPHSHLDTEFLPLKFMLPSLFLTYLSKVGKISELCRLVSLGE